MTSLNASRFAEFYKAVYAKADDPEFGPFPWQERVAQRACDGNWPSVIAVPTAAGKTACVDIAVFALACRQKQTPRRIFFVVDRRIVVDQAHLHAEKLAEALDRASDGILKEVADVLRDLAEPGWLELDSKERQRILSLRWDLLDELSDEKRRGLLKKLNSKDRSWIEVCPLHVYALRGGMYRETAWVRSPLQPTVIASTVDQVGSRLLFRGYGVSDSMKPIHAGLVGNDSLIILDEAHCARPFAQTMQAVKMYRAWGDSGGAPFQFVSLTATPNNDTPPEEVERDDESDQNHPVLGRRINASKPTTLVVATKATGKKWQTELVKELVTQARKLADEGFESVGIIVNRVSTARMVASELQAVLLTGRMRPIDRDRIFDEKLKSLFSNASGEPPQFVVGTQCLEVGADFDFHAIVTECASLDALRQRFGRLNRIAKRENTRAVVVVRADQVADSSDDPIYGASLSETWKWLNEKAIDQVIDFGIAAIRDYTKDLVPADFERLNAPTSDAPVLFPAHLDCWVQTAPIPSPDPDPSLFLHGRQRTIPDVQVVFRSDLGENQDQWSEIVALCPPSSSEAVPVRIGVFRRWLAGDQPRDDSSDVEGEPVAEDPAVESNERRTALRWRGPNDRRTGLVSDPSNVRPNDTFVIPASAQAIEILGDILIPVRDDGDEAFQRSRDRAILRLTPSVYPSLQIEELSEDDEDFSAKLTVLMESLLVGDPPDWLTRAISHLRVERNRFVEPHPTGGWVVTGKRRLYQFTPEFLEDDQSYQSLNRQRVTLEEHSRGVTVYARRFAKGCGLPLETYTQVGLYHDLGKLDRRFQAMLQGRSPRTASAPWLAKSGTAMGSRREREQARAVHKYPKGGRHELLSTALVATKTDDDLVLHLMATHHGSARPLADHVNENEFATEPFHAELFGQSFSIPSSRQSIAEWNTTLPDRFWRVVRKYGWWGSAYHEAVFRLADHAQSRSEQEDGWEPGSDTFHTPTLSTSDARVNLSEVELGGMDGANPLAFLAAIGALRLADQAFEGRAKLSWRRSGRWIPILHVMDGVDLVAQLHKIVHRKGNEKAAAEAQRLEKQYRAERKAVEAAQKAIKEQKLRGEARIIAIRERVLPLQMVADNARAKWLEALGQAVAAPFLSLGKTLSATEEEFRTFTQRIKDQLATSGAAARADADFAAGFGCEACITDNGRIAATQFQLITGSGHQFFLETLGSLMERITSEQLHRSLFGPWKYSDSRLSFRWDPIDDRRYAYAWDDPSNEEVKTEHGANLLAAFALPLFPLIPTSRGPVTTGFDLEKMPAVLTWPIWRQPLSVDSVRSLVANPCLQELNPKREQLQDFGVVEIFRSLRIEVGRPPLSKLNLTAGVTV